MSTNLGDEFLGVCRTRLLTTPNIPTDIAWWNRGLFEADGVTPKSPDPGTPFVSDQIVRWDSESRELGPSAWQRSDVTYQADLWIPKGRDAHFAMSLATAIKDVFRTGATLTVSGYEIEVLDGRVDAVQDPEWLRARVTIDMQFDHP